MFWQRLARSRNSMKIDKNIEIIDLGLYLPNEKTLVIADVHIGYEEALNKQGVLVPRFQFKDVYLRLEKILKKCNPSTVVINGDLKHEFGRISEQEWRETLKVLALISRYADKVILVRGNHDTVLGPIAKKKDMAVVDDYKVDDILITHGHKINRKKAKTIVIGHEHPAIGFRRQGRIEKFKCFLRGKYKKQDLIVMPSFCLATEGSDVTKEKLLSPYLKQKLDNFEVFVVADKVYGFGKIKNLK